jgi:histidinol phosphatase-like enzyme
VRCIHLATSIADAQINAITRLLEVAGHLPTPEELKERGRQDTRFFGPDAQFRYLRQLEEPTADEGFESVEKCAFDRRGEQGTDALLILDLDDVCASPAPVLDPAAVAVADAWRSAVGRWVRDGAMVVVTAWRPQIASGAATGTQVRQCFAGLEAALGVPIAHAWCPHPAGPPVCWCRKPIPGMILAALSATSWAPRRSLVVGGAADRTMAERLGTAFMSPKEFLEASG